MSGVPFSQFVNGGNLASGDIVVGLRGGADTQFTVSPSFIFSWVATSSTSISAAVNVGYIPLSASVTTITLPVSSSVGDSIRIAGYGNGGWVLAQNAGQTIYFGNKTTTTGVTGSLSSFDTHCAIEIVCAVANSSWVVLSAQGNITYV